MSTPGNEAQKITSLMGTRIYVNAARCKKCGALLVSQRVHDFRACPCGVFVDGGREYTRRGWPNGEPDEWFEELTQYEDAP